MEYVLVIFVVLVVALLLLGHVAQVDIGAMVNEALKGGR
jgi:hypothetical protein